MVSSYIVYGNVFEIDQARFFAYPSAHDEESNSFIMSAIQQNYREGDLILAEAIFFKDKVVDLSKTEGIPLNSSYNVRGWESENAMKTNCRINQLCNNYRVIYDKLENVDFEESKILTIQYLNECLACSDLILNQTLSAYYTQFLDKVILLIEDFNNNMLTNATTPTIFDLLLHLFDQANGQLHKDPIKKFAECVIQLVNFAKMGNARLQARLVPLLLCGTQYLVIEILSIGNLEERDAFAKQRAEYYLTKFKTNGVGQRLHFIGGSAHIRPLKEKYSPAIYKLLKEYPSVIIMARKEHDPNIPLDDTKEIHLLKQSKISWITP